MTNASKLMAGKRGLIMGVANDHSIAWGIAQTLHEHGAELAFTYQGDAFGKRVKPLVETLGAKLVLPADVENDQSLEAAFGAIERQWGGLDFLVHAIAFSDKQRAQGPLRRHHARQLPPHDGNLLLFVHRHRAARLAFDEERRRHDHADLCGLDARDAELQRHGRRQGGAGSLASATSPPISAATASASTRSRRGPCARSPAPPSATRASSSNGTNNMRR